MYQKWRDLLFLHWECDLQEIQQKLPQGLTVDAFEGKAYITVIPFQMFDSRLGKIPLPGGRSLLELNCRTYVLNAKKEPGIWFFSLDVSNRIFCQFGRLIFHLPYFKSYMDLEKENGKFHFSSEAEENSEDIFEWTLIGNLFRAEQGTLDYFLIERYRMYHFDKEKEVSFTNVAHSPYLLMRAEVTLCKHQLFERHKLFGVGGSPMHVHFSPGVDITIGA